MKYNKSLLPGFTALLAITLSTASSANSIDEFSKIIKSHQYACEEQFAVLFGNGFNVDKLSASDSIITLQTIVTDNSNFPPNLENKTTFNNIYNSTHVFAIHDAAEIIIQKPGAEIGQLLEYLSGDSPSPNWFQKLMRQLLNANNSIRSNLLSTTRSHVQIYNSLLAKGRQITPVTHSQGNLFVNDSYNGIHESLRQGVGIVSVANPDDVVADRDQRHAYENTAPFLTTGDVFYLNVLEDEIMDWLGSGDMNFDNYPGTLDAPNDPFGHSFINVYLDTTANQNPNAAQMISDETIARYDKTTPAKCRTAFFSPPNDLQQWFGKKSKRMVENNGLVKAIDYPTAVKTFGPNITLLDWKGAYENGVATKSLSYYGPSARFMGNAFSNHIYRDGQAFYKAPNGHAILGAAITVDDDDQEWIIAVTGEETDNFTVNYVWRRKAKKIQDLTIPDLNNAIEPSLYPEQVDDPYWEKVQSYFGGPFHNPTEDTTHYTGWFFNGAGTEAQTLRWKKVDFSFGDNYCPYTEICSDTFWITRKVNVLERHKIRLLGDGSSSFKSNLGYETGNSAAIGVDYLDDEELVLRVNNTRSIGDAMNVSVNASTWLEINKEPLTDTRVLECAQNGKYACRPWALDTSILRDGKGIVLNMHALESGVYNKDFQTDIGTGTDLTQRNLIHLYHIDLRSKTFEYSSVNNYEHSNRYEQHEIGAYSPFRSNSDLDANYYFSHNGDDPQLIGTVKVNQQNMFVSEWPWQHTYGNYHEGRAGSIKNLITGKNLIPPIRGQYNIFTHQIVPPMPVQMGRVVEPDGALLLSYELPGDIFYNYYSKGNLDALAGTSLSNTTVLPVGLN